MMMKPWILVMAGGGIGAVTRELLMLLVRTPESLGGIHLSILAANMTAALLIGVAAGLAGKGGIIGAGGKLFILTGIMGGLSTFSSLVWGVDSTIVDPTKRALSLFYLVASMVAGFLLVQLGLWLGQRATARRVAAARVNAVEQESHRS